MGSPAGLGGALPWLWVPGPTSCGSAPLSGTTPAPGGAFGIPVSGTGVSLGSPEPQAQGLSLSETLLWWASTRHLPLPLLAVLSSSSSMEAH